MTDTRPGVLLIEDSPDDRDLFKRALDRFEHVVGRGFDLFTANAKKGAIDLLSAANRFDAIVMDARVPNGEGYEKWQDETLALHAAVKDKAKGAPIVVWTGYPDAEMERVLLERGSYTLYKSNDYGGTVKAVLWVIDYDREHPGGPIEGLLKGVGRLVRGLEDETKSRCDNASD